MLKGCSEARDVVCVRFAGDGGGGAGGGRSSPGADAAVATAGEESLGAVDFGVGGGDEGCDVLLMALDYSLGFRGSFVEVVEVAG